MDDIPLKTKINSDDLINALLDDTYIGDFSQFMRHLIFEIRDCPDGLDLLATIEEDIKEAKSY